MPTFCPESRREVKTLAAACLEGFTEPTEWMQLVSLSATDLLHHSEYDGGRRGAKEQRA
jgi:hypothetical protein